MKKKSGVSPYPQSPFKGTADILVYWRKYGGARGTAIWMTRREIFLLAPAILCLALSANLPVTIIGLALAWIVFLWLCRFIALGHLSIATPVDLPIVLLLVLLPFNLYASPDVNLSLRGVWQSVGEVAVLYAVANWSNSEARVRWFESALIVLGIAVALVSLLTLNLPNTKFFDFGLLSSLLPRTVIPLLNPLGVNANAAGGLFAVLFPLALSKLIWSSSRASRLLALIGSLIFGAVVFLSQSRGAWIGVALALVVMALAVKRRFLFLLPVVAVALVVGVSIIGIQPALDYLSGGTALDSAAGRLEVWQHAIFILQDFPFTGVGLESFPKIAASLYPFFLLGPDTEIPHTHNIYLQVGVERGIPGMIAFIGMLTALTVTGVILLRRTLNTPFYGLAIGLFGSLVVFMTHGMFDNVIYTLKVSALIWAEFGLLLAVASRIETPSSTRDDTAQQRLAASSGWRSRAPWTWLQAVLIWVLVALAAITVIGTNPFLGLLLCLLGGVALGLQVVLVYGRALRIWS